MLKKISLLFLGMVLLVALIGDFSKVSAAVKPPSEPFVTYFEEEPSNISIVYMEDFLETLTDTEKPEVKEDELGNLYQYNDDGSLVIDIKDASTLEGYTGDNSIECIACVGGARVTLVKSGSRYTTYGTESIGVSGKYPLNPISFSKTVGWSNSYSGSLSATTASLSAVAGISVTKDGSATAGASLPLKVGQSGEIRYRYVYTNQKVIQTLRIGTQVSTNTIVAKGFSHIAYSSRVWY